MENKELLKGQHNFSLVQGGPLFQILRRAKLTDDAMTLLYRRIVFITLFCWLPIVCLAAVEGILVGNGVKVPCLFDADFHIRFLISMPFLIAAELASHRRIPPMVGNFLKRGLILDNAMEQFNAAIASALRLRNSVFAEVLQIVLVYAIGIFFLWQNYVALDADTWYMPITAEGPALSLAGKWFILISLPFFQFLLLRWFFRIFIWCRFLWQVSRIELNILPTHPDGVGGLGFLGGVGLAFYPVLLAYGALLAGLIANQIFYQGAVLTDFMVPVVFVVVFLMCLVYAPLLVFTPQLERTRRNGIAEYGALANSYMRDFDTKWLRGGAPEDEKLIGNADIQSLADIGNSFNVVKGMSIFIFSKETIFEMAVLTILPIMPLTLTMMPVEEVIKTVLSLLF